MNENLFLDFKNVEIHQQDNLILSDINLSIKKGEFVYFVGKTGSGKSSTNKKQKRAVLKKKDEMLLMSPANVIYPPNSLKKL